MKYLICNLKAHKTYYEMLAYQQELSKINNKTIEIIFIPTCLYLPLFQETNFKLGIQDVPLNETLYLTGDYSLKQLKSLNVKYAIIGHYERRKYYHETKELLLKKTQEALNHNLKIIYCIGEDINDLKANKHFEILTKELKYLFDNLPKLFNLIIAYEPNYLIGNNYNYNYLQLNKTITHLKQFSQNNYNIDIPIVFGGNINLENINSLKNLTNISGYILGNASLDPTNINKIIKIMTEP